MKCLKRISAVLFTLCLAFLQFTPVLAAEETGADVYTYTVRFFSGAQGTINGKEVVVKKNLHYGERVSFNQKQVALNDGSKYYIKGIRESGKDNSTASSTASFPVTGDMDYVVVYGLLSNAVSYTVNYVDTDGREVAPSETYYGNVGDEPVIAYLYVEGYQPQAYNLTGTLQADASKNVFNFVYTSTSAAPAATQPAATIAPPAQPGQPAATAAPGTVTAPAGQTGGTEETTGGETGEDAEAGAEEAGGNEDAEAEGGAEDAGPQELQRIDDEEAPLANTDLGMGNTAVDVKDFAKRLGDFPLAAKVGICAAVLLIVGAAAWFLLIRNKKQVIADE